MIDVESLANNDIFFSNCNFTRMHNFKQEGKISLNPEEYYSQHALSIYYRIGCDGYLTDINPTFTVSFVDSDFRQIDHYRKLISIDIIHVELLTSCYYNENGFILIILRNVTFYDNLSVLVNVTAVSMNYEPPISIITEDVFHIEENMLEDKPLIFLKNVQMQFCGVTRFVRNYFFTSIITIIHSDSSKIIFTNTTVFHQNELCMYLLNLNGKWLDILLAEHANVTISYNQLENEIISISKVYNNPFPLCIFQFNSNFYQNFSINIFNNTERSVDPNRSNSTINKFTSHCKLHMGKHYHVNDSLTIYKQVMKQSYDNYPLGIHTDICYCPTPNNSNCSVDWLGIVYPGQTLTVNLCLHMPYNNKESRILWVETYNDHLPPTACKVYSLIESKQKFHGKLSKVNFTIASNYSTRCELFLTTQPDLYTHYEGFYIQMLPCPLGFALHNDICECDPILYPYTEKCVINYQAVKRLSNCWISGNTRENSSKYYVANNCPVFYCSQTATMINVQKPDVQCHQHRIGTQCSQCKPGYSLVLGSSKCTKCTNAHLAFIAVLIFNGLLLCVVIFVLNLTVTVGMLNGIILYTHLIQINDLSLHLQSRLVKPLFAYASIINLTSYFEMCIYDGMDMYVKTWIHLAYPTYIVLIACIFIVACRISSKLFWLTHNRSLPILATLFVLTYTKLLQAVSSVFLYTTITSLPSMQFHVV